MRLISLPTWAFTIYLTNSFDETASQAKQIIEDALAVQAAGAFAVLLECVPSPVSKAVTEILDIPTIGIGAGPETSGQVLVFHDLMGMLQHPHHAQFVPKFCKRYAAVGEQIRIGLEEYREDVENRRFPNEDYSPYKVKIWSAAPDAVFRLTNLFLLRIDVKGGDAKAARSRGERVS